MRFSVIAMPVLAAIALAAPAPADAEARHIDKRGVVQVIAYIDVALTDLADLDVDGAVVALENALDALGAP